MIPILYDGNEVNFDSNGLGRLRDCISCKVTEERNGIYKCDFEYPIDGANYDLIQLGRIVGVTHEESDDIQPFDIVSYSRPIDGVVSFHAVHISYRLSKMVSYSSYVNSLRAALDALSNTFFPSTTERSPFTYRTDKVSAGYCPAFDGTPRSIRSLLGGVEGSILDTYGGEFEWDKWTVMLHNARGQLRDFTIRYGVNMTDFQDETDYSESFDACVPFWKDSSTGEIVMGQEITVYNELTGSHHNCVPLDLSDRFEERPSYNEINLMARDIMDAQRPYLPSQNIKVDFIRLQDEAGFDQFDELLQCKLCDSVKVIFPGYGMSAYFKIVKTTWDVLLDRYESMELGNLSTTLAEALGITDSGVSKDTSATISGGVFEFGNFRICVMSQNVGYGAQADYIYPAGTFSTVLGVVPFSNQLGFAAGSNISITNAASDHCTVYNYNIAGASMQIGIIAFGIG